MTESTNTDHKPLIVEQSDPTVNQTYGIPANPFGTIPTKPTSSTVELFLHNIQQRLDVMDRAIVALEEKVGLLVQLLDSDKAAINMLKKDTSMADGILHISLNELYTKMDKFGERVEALEPLFKLAEPRDLPQGDTTTK